MRLPAAPILAVLERAAIAQGYIGRGCHDDQASSLPGLQIFCEQILGIPERSIFRIRKRGTIRVEFADRLCIALKLHPIIVWPAEYGAWLHEDWTDRDSEERELARDEAARRLQARREYFNAASRKTYAKQKGAA